MDTHGVSDPKQYFSEPHNLPEDDTVYIFNTLMSKLENFRMSTYRRVFDIHWLSLFWRGFLFFFFFNVKYFKQYRDYNTEALLQQFNKSDFQ